MAASINNDPGGPAWVGQVRAQVESLLFGFVQVQVHDGRVVQVERTERFRFEGSAGGLLSNSNKVPTGIAPQETNTMDRQVQ